MYGLNRNDAAHQASLIAAFDDPSVPAEIQTLIRRATAIRASRQLLACLHLDLHEPVGAMFNARPSVQCQGDARYMLACQCR